MTTKPRHTTTKRRHSVDGRRATDIARRAQLERELSDALTELANKDQHIPKVGMCRKVRLVVILTVRHINGGGLPHRWEFTAPAGTWKTEAEHLARLAARKAGLTVHAHIDTEERLV
jgi:hypothetical protein